MNKHDQGGCRHSDREKRQGERERERAAGLDITRCRVARQLALIHYRAIILSARKARTIQPEQLDAMSTPLPLPIICIQLSAVRDRVQAPGCYGLAKVGAVVCLRW